MDRKTAERIMQGAAASGGAAYTLTQFSYDGMGRLECTAIRMNSAAYGSLPSSACALGTEGSQGPDRITKNVYDAAGQVLEVQKAVGTALQQDYATFTYSANGKPLTMADANGNVTGYSYDGFDRQVQWNFPSTTSPGNVSTTDYEAYGYDANGNRTSLRKRDGRTIGYSYDALNRVTVKTIAGSCVSGYACTAPPASAVRDVYYGYDLRGLQLYARFDSASGEGVTNAYDGFGRLTGSTTTMGGVSRTVSSLYDADGNRTRLTHPDGAYFDASYDGLDRMAGESWYTSVVGQVPFFGIGYDAQGRRSGTSRANGITTFGYDGVSRLSSLSHSFLSGSANVTSTFGYNPASQVTSQSRSNTAYAYTGYTAASNAYAVNGLNQYTAVGAGSLGYDSNGNLASTGGTTLSYDVENRLVTAAGTLTLSLAYDPLGRLWQTSGGYLGKSQFVYDGDRMIAEYDGDTGGMRRRFAYGAGEDEPILWDEGNLLDCSQTKFLHPDQQGSIVAVADCSGNPLKVNSYDEYGVPAAGNWAYEFQQRFQYTGQMWLPELGMYYYKARLYSARLGRFLQTDPIGYKDQNNLYAYVANDPVNGRDPTGEEDCGWACSAWQAVTSYVAQTLTRSEQVRNDYDSKRSALGPNDSAARSELKAATRAQTPAPMRAVIGAVRPSTGARAGSVGGAARGNASWSRAAGIAGTVGKVSAVASVVLGAVQIATSDNPAREASGVGGSTLGGVGGGIAGAEAGGALGLLGGPFAPVTVPGGAIIGGIAGSIGGGWLGDKAGKSIYDKVNQ